MSVCRKEAEDFRYVFWNVKDWGWGDYAEDETARTRRVFEIAHQLDFDGITFCEVCNPAVLDWAMAAFGVDYDYYLSSDQSISPRRLLTVVKKTDATHHVSVTDYKDFTSTSGWSRHSHLIQVQDGMNKYGSCVAILPVHLKSSVHEGSYKIRQAQHKAFIETGASFSKEGMPLLVLGDMNTMGFSSGNISVKCPADEQKLIKRLYMTHDFVSLRKSFECTWKGIGDDAQYPPAILDHAFIKDMGLSLIKHFENGSAVQVGGWPDFPTEDKQHEWIKNVSDHAYLVLDLKL